MNVLEAWVSSPSDLISFVLILSLNFRSIVVIKLSEETIEENANGLTDNEDDFRFADLKARLAHINDIILYISK
jgi:hypothetical protein